MNQFNNKRVVVMGLGRFGGGVGVTRALVEAGASVLVTDTSSSDALSQSIEQLNNLESTGRIVYRFGPHDPAYLDDADVLIANPAVPTPWKNPFLCEARSRGITITTEIELAYRRTPPSNIIAVTGSAGKSTTSAMIHHGLLQLGYEAKLVGNIGGSALETINSTSSPDQTIFVMELSSAMLYWLWGAPTNSNPLPRPAVACVTNCLPNHLDWHGTFEHYQASKKLLINDAPETTSIVIGESIATWAPTAHNRVQIILADDVTAECQLPGIHNAFNATLAAGAIRCFFSDQLVPEQLGIEHAVGSFPGLPHRLHLCHRANGVVFYNDSKSTVPQATVLAIEAISEQTPPGHIHLICGGYDKGSDLSPIANIAHNFGSVHTIGQVGQDLADQCRGHYALDLDHAIKSAIDLAQPGDAVLLSPGCASWDQFTNYEERGNAFSALVHQYTKADAST
ncbi:MAG: UDP-N-acetylmuramoyl-L-alanine--D-glutamate ligase [Phycisphaerales bacterium]